MSTSTVSEKRVNGNGHFHAVPARYKGVCRLCDQPIDRGQMVLPVKHMRGRTRWAHEACVLADESDQPTGCTVDPAEAERHKAAIDHHKEVIDTLVREVIRLGERIESIESATPRTIELRTPEGDIRKIDGAVHPAIERIVQLAQARKNIFLPGPSGCGKSHLARQVAEALDLRFGCISCSAGMSESQLLGRMVPTGDHGQFEFLTTQFLECYENGGVFLFDEIDAADSNVLLVINSALANGHLSVPSRHDNPVATRHPDFVCIAAANTWGRGADRQYVGRNELDEATIDRFRIGCVPMDYDESLEAQLCPDADLRGRLQTYRRRVQENRLERIVSTRFIAEAYEMKARWGWSDEQIDGQLFNGWRDDEIRKVKGGMR